MTSSTTFRLGPCEIDEARRSLTAHGRYVPESILDPTKIGPEDDGYDVLLPNGVNFNRVNARFYLDLAGSVRPTANFLGGGKVSINETAYLVGFSEPAAFSRAFKRWTGLTPKLYRQQFETSRDDSLSAAFSMAVANQSAGV